ncbi:MAG: MotA/TolQ/ExbB proton channel family protein [Gammaproteobacteria bacterium]|nr:MotA/TolQ/ExbB proton channel family protein [Gammaproteobacteria bacterium]
MFEIVQAGGWMMLPIIFCSVLAAAIIFERLFTLQQKRVLPKDLAAKVWFWVERQQLDGRSIRAIQESSPLGQILAAGLINRHGDREIMKESIEDTGRHVVHDLERFINPLGTIAAITPLMGLLGTVWGMIKVFDAITTAGVGDPQALAGGINEALITTAAGLAVAIPSLIGYRYLRSRVDSLVVQMEKEAMKLIEAIYGGDRREELRDQ